MTKTKDKTSKWEYVGPNYVLRKVGWTASFNPATFTNAFADFDKIFEEISGEKAGDQETALIIGEGRGKMYILNGDWRKECEKIGTAKQALAFFNSKKEKYRSAWSEDIDLFPTNESI